MFSASDLLNDRRASTKCNLIVLDVGGVLYTNLLPPLTCAVARATACDEDTVSSACESEGLRDGLWRGHISPDDFWSSLGKRLGCRLDSAYWNEQCLVLQVPVLSRLLLNKLLPTCDVALLTNHRMEWLLPVLERDGLGKSFSPIVISSTEGFVKPEREIYQCLERLLRRPYDRRLFVDDKPANLQPAEQLGYQTIVADTGHDWEKTLTQWIA